MNDSANATDTDRSPGKEQGLHQLLPQAVSLHQAGQIAEATKLYHAILSDDPSNFDAQHLLGVIALQEGRLAEAQAMISAALEATPTAVPAISNLTTALLRDRKLEEALQMGLRGLALGLDLDLLINVGTVYYELGRYLEAIEPLQRAFAVAPRSTIICNLLGACYLKCGDAAEAARIFEFATHASPDDSDGWSNLSTALKAMSEHERALQCAERALALKHDSSAALGAQAAALYELGKIDESIVAYRRAVESKPTVDTLCGLANALIMSGQHDEAVPFLRRATEVDNKNPLARWILALSVLQPIYRREEDVLKSREDFATALGDLESWPKANPDVGTYTAVAGAQPFYIAYHSINNVALLSRYGDVCAQWIKSLPGSLEPPRKPAPGRAKIRLGFVSAYIRNHSVWNAITKGWVENIDRSKFEIFIFQLSARQDKETDQARKHSDYIDASPKGLADWMKAIREAAVDMLIYPDIGMDPMTTQLASMRLAPLQAASWGHPESTGLPTMDYYLSGDALEPANAQDNYREKIVRLPNLGVHILPLKPKIADPDFEYMRLPKKEPLLLCPGTPFKYLPHYDRIWAGIAKGLEAKGTGRLVFFASPQGSMYVMLIERLRASFKREGIDFDARCTVIPVLNRNRFYGLMHASALALDTPGFSAFNTAMQAIECDLPYLAYEGAFMRGRLASGLFRRMNIPDLIVNNDQAFIERAVQLATDKKALKRLRSDIVSRRKMLFSDLEPVRGLERFVQQAVAAERAGR